jgi:hypothetical protein
LGAGIVAAHPQDAAKKEETAFVSRIPAANRSEAAAVWRRHSGPIAEVWKNPVIASCTPTLKLTARGLPIDRRTTQVIGNLPAAVVSGSIEVRGTDDLRKALLSLPDAAWSYGRIVGLEMCRATADDPQSASDIQAVQRLLKRLSVEWVQ